VPLDGQFPAQAQYERDVPGAAGRPGTDEDDADDHCDAVAGQPGDPGVVECVGHGGGKGEEGSDRRAGGEVLTPEDRKSRIVVRGLSCSTSKATGWACCPRAGPPRQVLLRGPGAPGAAVSFSM
jgi:hypothetical protein